MSGTLSRHSFGPAYSSHNVFVRLCGCSQIEWTLPAQQASWNFQIVQYRLNRMNNEHFTGHSHPFTRPTWIVGLRYWSAIGPWLTDLVCLRGRSAFLRVSVVRRNGYILKQDMPIYFVHLLLCITLSSLLFDSLYSLRLLVISALKCSLWFNLTYIECIYGLTCKNIASKTKWDRWVAIHTLMAVHLKRWQKICWILCIVMPHKLMNAICMV